MKYAYIILIIVLGAAMMWLQSIGGLPWIMIAPILIATNNVYWLQRTQR